MKKENELKAHANSFNFKHFELKYEVLFYFHDKITFSRIYLSYNIKEIG